jgi:hypothetical protein
MTKAPAPAEAFDPDRGSGYGLTVIVTGVE